MPKTLTQTIAFKAGAAELYELYMNPKLHAQATGAAAKFQRKANAGFSAGDGYCRGKFLFLEQGEMIVQTWRGSDWGTEADSVLVLVFQGKEGGATVSLTQANIPDAMYESVKKGWDDSYWKKWKDYLGAQKGAKGEAPKKAAPGKGGKKADKPAKTGIKVPRPAAAIKAKVTTAKKAVKKAGAAAPQEVVAKPETKKAAPKGTAKTRK